MPGIYDSAIRAGQRVIPLLDQAALQHVNLVQRDIEQRFPLFVASLPEQVGKAPETADDKFATYTDSTAYFEHLAEGHRDELTSAFLASALHISQQPAAHICSVTDAGCMFGGSGLVMAMAGIKTTFHDFPGIGLDFIRWYAKEAHIEPYVELLPYGAPIHKADLCLALDVLEHTGNHLATLRWLKQLGQIICMTYPVSVPWNYPFDNAKVIDEWVDDEAIGWVLQRRHDVLFTSLHYERRMVIFQ